MSSLYQRMAQGFDVAPAVAKGAKLSSLPAVEAPSLDDLQVEVRALPSITLAEVEDALEDVLFARARVTSKLASEAIEPNDEVLVDLVGYSGGCVVPASARKDVWLCSRDDAELPGLRQALVGKKPGKSVQVKVAFPSDYPLEILQGAEVHYAVDIKAAQRVTIPAVDDPELLKELGLASQEALFQALLDDLIEEREAELESQILHAIADELQRRLGDLTIAPEVVTAELDQRWKWSEGDILAEKFVSRKSQSYARNAFVQDECLRAEMIHGLRVTMALGALAMKHTLGPTPERLRVLVEAHAQQTDSTPEQVIEELKKEPDVLSRLGAALALESAFDYALSKATFTVVDS